MIGKICFKGKEHSKIKHSYFDLIIGEGHYNIRVLLSIQRRDLYPCIVLLQSLMKEVNSKERSLPMHCVATVTNGGSVSTQSVTKGFSPVVYCYKHG